VLFLTKAMALLLLPPAVLILVAAFGMLMGGRRFGRFLIWSSLILLYLLSTEPVSDALLQPLESQAPHPCKLIKVPVVEQPRHWYTMNPGTFVLLLSPKIRYGF